MSKILLTLFFGLLVITPITPSQAQQESDAPYIYYYSEVLNGLVIERADGTDSRVIGQGLVTEDVLFTYGPGWSPDGKWFAWRVYTEPNLRAQVGKGYVVNVSDTDTLSMLEDFACVHQMLWHPTENILMVRGTILPLENGCKQDATPVATTWLIDVDAQQLLATFSINGYVGGTPAYWFPEERQLHFFESVPNHDDEPGWQDYLVTMSFDGTVIMKPVSQERAAAGLDDGIPLDIAYQTGGETLFSSYPDPYPLPEEEMVNLPHNSSAAVGIVVSWQWDVASEWLLVGYEFCFAGCANVTGRVNIYHPESEHTREISDCGGHPTCVGWLPDRVDTTKLPPGSLTSVLPTPDSVDYDNGYLEWGYSVGITEANFTHRLGCDNEDTWLLNQVKDAETGELDFVLPGQPRCDNYDRLDEDYYFTNIPIIFALSPDENYYAITEERGYTSLYDAQTGEHIATLNIFGIKLAFSEDSRYLITTGRYLEATWDIAELESRTLD